jgi:hypothetical protein
LERFKERFMAQEIKLRLELLLLLQENRQPARLRFLL